MNSAVKPIPDGHHTITPHLVIRGLAEAISFYEKALGAVEIYRMPMPDGTVGHAEIRIGNSIVFLGAEAPDWGALSPSTLGGSGVTIHIYVEDADALFAQAVEAGATVKMPMMDAPWGDRYGKLTDPFGHEWSLATHKEDLTPEEIMNRMTAEMCPESVEV